MEKLTNPEGNIALGIIDAQRGFMPAEEGERLGVEGFGELPIEGGELIVPNVNALFAEFRRNNRQMFTTQDWHPRETAHFADEPNFTTTWPVHCVGDTPGAQLHPDIEVPTAARAFLKGMEKLEDGADDTSYSGFNGYNENYGQRPDEFLKIRRVKQVYIGGLALDYCVKATALDLKQKGQYDVTVVTDATKPVAAETGAQAMEELAEAGVKFATTEEVLQRIAELGVADYAEFEKLQTLKTPR